MADLTRKRKRVTKAVRLLTDPDPQFVSLVSNGANQTPFKAVKSDGSEGDTEVVVAGVRATDTNEPSEDEMSKKTTAATTAKKLVVRTAGDGADLHKLVFPADKFGSEQAVRSYLDTNGYEGGDITALDAGGFEVIARAESDFKSVSEITGDDGVVRHLGVTVEAETTTVEKTEGTDVDATGTGDTGEDVGTTDPETEVQRTFVELAPVLATKVTPELVKRYDYWMASYSSGKTIAAVMADGVDGLPPAIYELNDAFYTALRNVILDNEPEKVATLVAEFGQMILVLVNTFSFATLPAEVTQKMLGGQTITGEVVTKSAEEPSIDVETLAQKATDLVLSKLSGMGITSEALQLVSKSVADANDGVNTRLLGIEQAVKAGDDKLAENAQTLADLAQKVEGLTGRAQRLEQVSVVSRAMDFDNPPNSSTAPSTTVQKSSDKVSTSLRNELGLG